MTARATILSLAAAAFALAFGWRLVWNSAANEMETALSRWIADQRENGVSAEYSSLTIGGFPFHLNASFTSAAIALDDGAFWRAPELRLTSPLYFPNRLTFSAGKEQTFRIKDGPEWTVKSENTRGRLDRAGKENWRATFTAENTTLTDGREKRIDLGFLELLAAPQESSEQVIEIDIRADDIRTDIRRGPINVNNAVAQLAVEKSQPERIVISLEQIEVVLADARLDADGGLTVPADGRASGIINATLVNPGAFTPLFAAAGFIPENRIEQTEAMLTLAAIAAGGALSAPIVIEGGRATLAGVEIGRPAPGHQP